MGYRPPPGLVHGILSPLTGSLRYHLYGMDHLRTAARMSPTGTAIFCLWHQSLLTVLGLGRQVRLKVAALASLSGDGQIIADYLRAEGVRPVRGSSARGGARAAKELIGALEDGYHLAIAIDGPRGPFKRVKAGTIDLARRYRIPLIPIAARATREISIKRSWDRFRVPLPWGHVALACGAPLIFPPAEPSADEEIGRCRLLGHRLHALEERVSRLARRPDTIPPREALRWLEDDAPRPPMTGWPASR